MQKTSKQTHESWICSKIIFLELLMSMASFSYSKQDKSKNTIKLHGTKLKKLPQILGMKIKLIELVLPFYHFSVKCYIQNKISDREYKNTLNIY